jgi:hypothetical protein
VANKPDAYRPITGKLFYSNVSLPDKDNVNELPMENSPPSKIAEEGVEGEQSLVEEETFERLRKHHCQVCGINVHENDNYCTNCGQSLGAIVSQPVVKVRKVRLLKQNKFDSIESLAAEGFRGFYPLYEVRADPNLVPKEKGIYLVLYPFHQQPEFLSIGTGGWFKGKNPNVDLATLKSKWIEGAVVLYIGQAGGEREGVLTASTLRRRVKTCVAFGQRKKKGHRGGRYIWQIRDSNKLLVCWRVSSERSEDSRKLEAKLLSEFEDHYGKLPFANLQG